MSSLVGNLARSVNSVPLHAMPPLSAYAVWLRDRHSGLRGNPTHIGADVHRRIAQLRRLGDTWNEIARCVRLTPPCVKKCWNRLPAELR
jgi:hypothetical protein